MKVKHIDDTVYEVEFSKDELTLLKCIAKRLSVTVGKLILSWLLIQIRMFTKLIE